MQKALTQINLQLHHVVAEITGVTGMQIMRAIIAGNHNPAALAAYREISEALNDASIAQRPYVGTEAFFRLTRGSAHLGPA
jgi:hypothetical protein